MPATAGDLRDVGSISGLERSPGGGHGNLLQYSCLENHVDRGVWQATVHGLTESGQDWSYLGGTCITITKWQLFGEVKQASDSKQSGPLTLLLTWLDTALTTRLLVSALTPTGNMNGNIDKTRSRSWNSWAPGWGLANHTQGLTKSFDWQDKQHCKED